MNGDILPRYIWEKQWLASFEYFIYEIPVADVAGVQLWCELILRLFVQAKELNLSHPVRPWSNLNTRLIGTPSSPFGIAGWGTMSMYPLAA